MRMRIEGLGIVCAALLTLTTAPTVAADHPEDLGGSAVRWAESYLCVPFLIAEGLAENGGLPGDPAFEDFIWFACDPSSPLGEVETAANGSVDHAYGTTDEAAFCAAYWAEDTLAELPTVLRGGGGVAPPLGCAP